MDPNSDSKVILVVDDEESVLVLMKKQLELEGYTVVTVMSGYQVAKFVQTMEFHAILLDLNLGDMNGMDVLNTVKQIKPEQTVIMITGIHSELEARKAIALGALDYVTKPIDFDYLNNILAMQA